MVIAPLVSPVLTASVGAVRNDQEMLISSIQMQALGLGVAVLTATAFAWIIQQLRVVPVTLAIERMELIGLRISPSILAIAIGVTAGAAGAYGLATKGDVTIVGVMIAAALIPTAAATGIGIAWRLPVVAVGSLLLLVLSVIAVNVGGTLMLLYLEYRPDDVDQGILSFDDAYRATVVLGTLLLTIVTVISVGFLFVQQSDFERSVNDAITDVVNDEEYSGLNVMSTSIEYNAPVLSNETTVTITVARTTNGTFPSLPNRVEREITNRTGESVLVEIRYVDYAQSNTSASGRPTVVVTTPRQSVSTADWPRSDRSGHRVSEKRNERPL
jgi:hypothetical protein